MVGALGVVLADLVVSLGINTVVAAGQMAAGGMHMKIHPGGLFGALVLCHGLI